jgi:hypothetical protein
MPPFKGLGAIIPFTGEKLRDYRRNGIDTSERDGRYLIEVISHQGHAR